MLIRRESGCVGVLKIKLGVALILGAERRADGLQLRDVALAGLFRWHGFPRSSLIDSKAPPREYRGATSLIDRPHACLGRFSAPMVARPFHKVRILRTRTICPLHGTFRARSSRTAAGAAGSASLWFSPIAEPWYASMSPFMIFGERT
jgi:hypothetical protein